MQITDKIGQKVRMKTGAVGTIVAVDAAIAAVNPGDAGLSEIREYI